MLQNVCKYKLCWFTNKKLKIYQILCPKKIILNFAYKTRPNISKSTKCCFHELPCMIREEGSTYQPVIALPFQHYIDNMHTAGDFIDKSIRGGPGLGGTFCDIGGYNFDFLWIDIKTYKNMSE